MSSNRRWCRSSRCSNCLLLLLWLRQGVRCHVNGLLLLPIGRPAHNSLIRRRRGRHTGRTTRQAQLTSCNATPSAARVDYPAQLTLTMLTFSRSYNELDQWLICQKKISMEAQSTDNISFIHHFISISCIHFPSRLFPFLSALCLM